MPTIYANTDNATQGTLYDSTSVQGGSESDIVDAIAQLTKRNLKAISA